MKRLGGWDAVLLYGEAPNLTQHTLKVAVVDTTDVPDFDYHLFRRTLERRLPLLDPLRYQLVPIPWKFHRPMWREKCDVDLDYHLRHYTIRPPGDHRQLDAAVADIACAPLDRSRPLWEFYFVEGLADHRFAVIGKVHHALADGVASANLMARALDLPGSRPLGQQCCRPDPEPTDIHLLGAAALDHVKAIGELPSLARDTVRGWVRLRREAETRRDLARNFRPPRTFLNHRVSAGRKFASDTLSLAEVKDTAKSLGVTINDLVLTMAAGAIRDLLLRYDGRADEPLLCGVPLSIDTSPDRVSGNALGTIVVSLPVHIDDTHERLRLTRDGARMGKEKTQLLGPDLVSRWSNYAPPIVLKWLLQHVATSDSPNKIINVPVSNVPGPRTAGHIAGAPVVEIYSVGPLTFGVGINITVWSYVDQLSVCVLTDDDTVDDPHEVTDAMARAFCDLRRLADPPTLRDAH